MLRLTPYAWAKLIHLRDVGPTEVGGFGVANVNDSLLVEDVRLVDQWATPITVTFDDASVADFFDAMVDAGRHPESFARIWVHTHPDASAEPSILDWQTFASAFGSCDWAVMLIVARSGDATAFLRTRFGEVDQIPIAIDFGVPFPGSDPVAWTTEHGDHVRDVTACDWFEPLIPMPT